MFGYTPQEFGSDQQIAELKARLKKGWGISKAGATLGTPTQGSAVSDSPFAAMVPQSIDKMWSSETLSEDDVVLSKTLVKKDIISSRHETVVVTSYGDRDVPNFMPEGTSSIPSVETTKIDKRIVDIKYFGTHRRITHQASAAGILGGINPGGAPMVSRQGLEFETANGIRSMIENYESALWRADSAIWSLEFDGVLTQIDANGVADVNVIDLRNTNLTWERLLVDIARISGRPKFAKIDMVCLDDQVWATLSAQGAPNGRWTQMGADGNVALGGGWQFNPSGMYLVTARQRKIKLVLTPLINHYPEISGALSGSPAGTFGAGQVTSITPAPGTGQFGAADAGLYYYKIKAFFVQGAALEYTTPQKTIAAGDVVPFDLADAAIKSTSGNELVAYEIWRSDKNGAASTCKFMKRFKSNALGTAAGSLFTDTNSDIPGTSHVACLQTTEGAMYEAVLLGTMRFPIPQPFLVTDFVIARFSAPHVVHPRRQIHYKNVKNTI
jgi:hypothetical protein